MVVVSWQPGAVCVACSAVRVAHCVRRVRVGGEVCLMAVDAVACGCRRNGRAGPDKAPVAAVVTPGAVVFYRIVRAAEGHDLVRMF